MRSVTEFFTHKLVKGLDTQKALAAEGKTPEEIQTSLGEAFKLEGEKLTYFINSLDVASKNMEQLARVLVVKFNEGETVPPKAVHIEDTYYIPEFNRPAAAPVLTKPAPETGKKGRSGGGKGPRRDGPKSSPWGITPEEAAAKKAQGKKQAAAPKS